MMIAGFLLGMSQQWPAAWSAEEGSKMRVSLALIAAVLAGCASGDYAGDYAQCMVPVTRDAGMGVEVPACVAWQFPNSEQTRSGAQTTRFGSKDAKP